MARGATAFGEQLRRLRERALLTQEQLAERAGIATDSVGGYERGRHTPSLPNARALADALGLADDELTAFAALAADARKEDAGAMSWPLAPAPPPQPRAPFFDRDDDLTALARLLAACRREPDPPDLSALSV